MCEGSPWLNGIYVSFFQNVCPNEFSSRKRREARDGPVALPSSVLELGNHYQVFRWKRQLSSLQRKGREELESLDLLKQSVTVIVGPAENPDLTREYTIGEPVIRSDQRRQDVKPPGVVHRNEHHPMPGSQSIRNVVEQENDPWEDGEWNRTLNPFLSQSQN